MTRRGKIFIKDEIAKDGKKEAVIITKHLAVARSNELLDINTYKVYCIATNQPVLDCRVADYNSAVTLAEWIEQVYGVYLDIYSIYPDWDVLAIARLSVEKGEKTFAELQGFDGGVITTEQMEKARQRALA